MRKKVPLERRFSISLDEWVLIGAILILAMVLIGLIPTLMRSEWFLGLIPPFQYILYNIGFILLTIVLIGAPISHLLRERMSILTMLQSGLSTWLIFSFIMDMWQPPFSYNQEGTLLITQNETLIGTSVDFMLGWLYSSILPESTLLLTLPLFGDVSLLFLLIYFATPIGAVILAALLFQPKVLARMLSRG